jgi:hypothetical protein
VSAAVPRFGEVAAQLVENGYAPLPVHFGRKNPSAGEGWQRYKFREDDLQRFASHGTGILCGQVIGLDIDVRDPDLAAKLEEIADGMFGPAPRRTGQPPKVLRLYQAERPFTKLSTRGYRFPSDGPEDKTHRVEVLAQGQQFVAYNQHPDTGRPYTWNGGGDPLTVPIGLLATVSEEGAKVFVAAAEKLLAEHGRPVGKLVQSDDARAHESSEEQRAADPALLRQALAALPNENLEFDDWIRVLYATKGALGEDGIEDFLRWSVKSSKDVPAFSTREYCAARPTKIGAGTLYHLAAQQGWKRDPTNGADQWELPPVEAYQDESGMADSREVRTTAPATKQPPASPRKEPRPWDIPPVSSWANQPAPPPRDWICEGIALGAGRVISLLGNGGFGKTMIASQLSVAAAATGTLWGMPVSRGPVLGIFCEDEQDEVSRRVRLIAESEGVSLESLDNLHMHSRDGEDNALVAFHQDLIMLTAAYWELDATLALLKPRLTILDTAADIFAGDFMSTPHVRQFIKVALGGYCKRHGTAILLLAHPSAAAMTSGEGGGFSTAWNNSVRSRLYLRRPKSDDAEAAADRRILEVKKSNYGPSGAIIPLIYQGGQFVLDPEPVEENSAPRAKASGAKANTRQAIEVLAHFEKSAAIVVPFGTIYKALNGTAPGRSADDEKKRKSLSRTLKCLCEENLLQQTRTPKGYRIAPEQAA